MPCSWWTCSFSFLHILGTSIARGARCKFITFDTPFHARGTAHRKVVPAVTIHLQITLWSGMQMYVFLRPLSLVL